MEVVITPAQSALVEMERMVVAREPMTLQITPRLVQPHSLVELVAGLPSIALPLTVVLVEEVVVLDRMGASLSVESLVQVGLVWQSGEPPMQVVAEAVGLMMEHLAQVEQGVVELVGTTGSQESTGQLISEAVAEEEAEGS